MMCAVGDEKVFVATKQDLNGHLFMNLMHNTMRGTAFDEPIPSWDDYYRVEEGAEDMWRTRRCSSTITVSFDKSCSTANRDYLRTLTRNSITSNPVISRLSK